MTQERLPHHELGVFIGNWQAEGTTYGGPDQNPTDPKAERHPWRSIHTARWYSGEFFVVQDEHANGPFDTLMLLGWDAEEGRYFARTVSNLGFARDYTMELTGSDGSDGADGGLTWRLSGASERATYRFVDDGRNQEISWEWRPDGEWLPLCDRTARRID
jgi:hypothetical protein